MGHPEKSEYGKKTATLTFQSADNYGAALQAYALHKALIKIGVENEVLNYQCKYMGTPYGLAALRRKGVIRWFLGIAYYIVRMPRRKKFREFRSLIKMTPALNLTELHGLENHYDAFIVGSDQVWNDSITDLDPSYFFDFVKSQQKKLTYGASFGFESMSDDLKPKYSDLLKDFNVFNMREESGVKIVESLLNKSANLVLDPTMLLAKEEWDALSRPVIKKDKYILVYQVTVSAFALRTARDLARSTGYDVITVPFPLGGFLRSRLELSAGPIEWIRLIRDAEIVVTDSFHGCAFSILYNKDFYVCLTDAATRIYNLLNIFQLKDRICVSDCELETTKKIDWESVNGKLNEERKKSIGALKVMLGVEHNS